MHRQFGSRTLLVICTALAILLAVLAIVQYRWSARVAAADAQREREHLQTAAALFANRFNDSILAVIQFMQNDAQRAFDRGTPLSRPPRIVGEFYNVSDRPVENAIAVNRLTAEGRFVPIDAPDWIKTMHCSASVGSTPPAVVFPMLHVETLDKTSSATFRILRSLPDRRCFVAKLDETYVNKELLPQLIGQTFGEAAVRDYQFAVIDREHPKDIVYGTAVQADLKKPFFAMAFRMPSLPPPVAKPQTQDMAVFVQRFEYNVVTTSRPASRMLNDGVWELDVAHKDVPLDAAFEQTRRRNLFFSITVEVLLIATIIFLVVAVRRMQRLAEQKMQFVAAVSHELRAPVSAISMLSRNQADGLVTSGDKVQQYGELMHQQSRRLNEMVEQTLQYAGIHSNLGHPKQTEIDFERLINEAVDARRDELGRQAFEVNVEIGQGLPAVHGDPKLLRIAVDNLLSNAEKYADGGRWIRVSARYAPEAREVLISVEDRGPGIASEEQQEIFEPFSRGKAAVEAQIPGSGIGLSLVRSAAEAHRGTVTLVSEPGRGSTFTLHLPV